MLLHYRSRGLHALLCISSAIAACLLFWFVAAGLFENIMKRPLADPEAYLMCTMIIAVGILFNGMRLSLKEIDFTALDDIAVARLSLMQVTSVLFLLLFWLVSVKNQTLSRLVIATFIPLLFFLLFFCNRSLPKLFARFLFSGLHRHKTLLIGVPESRNAFKRWIAQKRAYGIDVVGALVEDHEAHRSAGVPVLGAPSDLDAHIKSTGCSQVMLIKFPLSSVEIKGMAASCERLGVRFIVLADWVGMLGRRLTVTSDQGMNILSFHREPLQSPWNRIFKRGFDLTLSLFVVVLLLPWITAFVWILQRFQSPGPVFFRQKRTGVQCREFTILKYRSMHLGHGDEARQASPEDERVFPAGRWLRRLSIDELPQFINVLRGEMSVVGPRPHLSAHDERFETQIRRYRIRHLVKPGITGLAQVRGFRGETRTDSEVIRRIRADLQYVQEWSLFLDIFIVMKTAILCLKIPKSSY